MFDRLLIANRGEIACRVARTARRMGIRTVAVYSDADVGALHVAACDEAHRLGPAPPRESYLRGDRIIQIARSAGAQAIHPGYGFLSENEAFAAAVAAAGLVFVGPPPAAIRAMGSKSESKSIMAKAGVRLVPGYHGADQDDALLAREADGVGYPVLIKASAGGGGKGMRIVERRADFAAALASARREAKASFGDDKMLLEKYLDEPRHIEMQVFADTHGHCVHLFERDCSVQRNNQKLLEEAPAPNLPESVRGKLFEAALKLGRTIGYDSAGTVEFIMDRDSAAPYFLEMNTRLQVEHPVTELITGIDLVEWQLLAAAGETLPLTQEQIRTRGHAIEARITAERADLGFQPVTGKLADVSAPHGIRFDNGVETGSEVSLYYDSMLAKLISHGSDRAAALMRLTNGLTELTLLGVPTIQPFLRDASRHQLFAEGKATTRFIEVAFPGGWKPNPEELRTLRAAACVVWAGLDNAEPSAQWINPWHRRSAVRVTSAVRPAIASLNLTDEYGHVDVEVLVGREGITVELEGASINLGRPVVEDGAIKLASPSGHPFLARRDGPIVSITREGLSLSATICLRIEMPREHGHHEKSGNVIEAPLHGVVSQLHVALGDTVEKGAAVLQMEAMKLIHTLRAQVTGRIGQICCSVGDTVPAGAILIEITPSEVEEKS